MFLNDKEFMRVIKNSPLFSIDLVLTNGLEVLLGKRLNRPAKDYWFVPGGRVRKNERLSLAIERISQDELGVTISQADTVSLGVFEHFYSDSVFGPEPSTHYVAYGLSIEKAIDPKRLPGDQHEAYRWWSMEEAIDSDNVHHFTKQYLTQLCRKD